MYHANINQREAEEAILIGGKINLRVKNIT